jgi:hypothetical protein
MPGAVLRACSPVLAVGSQNLRKAPGYIMAEQRIKPRHRAPQLLRRAPGEVAQKAKSPDADALKHPKAQNLKPKTPQTRTQGTLRAPPGATGSRAKRKIRA